MALLSICLKKPSEGFFIMLKIILNEKLADFCVKRGGGGRNFSTKSRKNVFFCQFSLKIVAAYQDIAHLNALR